MILIYECINCEARNEVDAPPIIASHTPEQLMETLEPVGLERTFAGVRVRPWVRHPCAPGVHGIAQLVAIVE